MVYQKRKLVVIPKEKAVFWINKNGEWCNEHGKFEHPGIIKYFNASIKKDDNGYFVHQSSDELEEKVYFPYEETAVFAIDIIDKKEFTLITNTGQTINVNPENLFEKDDSLYMETIDHTIKFTSRA
ncbi:MAG: MFS transporter permease, partial [Desulfobacula sp.]|nr:MFS transporter permease [Desulfobacula sp.]